MVEGTGLSKLQEIGPQFIILPMNRLTLLFGHTRVDIKSLMPHVHHNLNPASLQTSFTTTSFRNIEIHSLAAIRSSFEPPFITSLPSR